MGVNRSDIRENTVEHLKMLEAAGIEHTQASAILIVIDRIATDKVLRLLDALKR